MRSEESPADQEIRTLSGPEREQLMVEFIDITKSSRLKIEADPVPLNPRMDECVTGCWTPQTAWYPYIDGPYEKFQFPGNLELAHERARNTSDPEGTMRRWAWANFHILVERHERSYWFCDQAMFETMIGGEFSKELQHDIIAADVYAYQRYERGEAQIVSLQRKATFKRVGKRVAYNDIDLLELWEDVSSIGDTYLDDYSAAQCALDHFPLDKKELTIITAMIDEARN
jgi:hypothetical protein